MMFEVSRILRHACYWLLWRYGDALDIVDAVQHLKPGMSTVYSRVQSFVSNVSKERLKAVAEEHMRLGTPDKLARKMAGLLLTRGGLDITDLSNIYKKDITDTARMYSTLSERLGFIWLNRSVEELAVEGRWQAIARSNLRDEFYRLRRDLSASLLKRRSKLEPIDLFEAWLEEHGVAVRKLDTVIAEMKLRPEIDFATLSVAAQELRRLAALTFED
jgi:glutamate dehydrogenase